MSLSFIAKQRPVSLNPIKELSHIVKMHGKKLIVDCMSSFGGILRCKRTRYRLPNQQFQQSVFEVYRIRIHHRPPFGIKNIAKEWHALFPWTSTTNGKQWKRTRKMALHFTDTRCPCFQTSPTELIEEGGVEARYQRYCENHRILVEGMRALGFKTLLEDDIQSPIITSSFIRMKDSTSKHSTMH